MKRGAMNSSALARIQRGTSSVRAAVTCAVAYDDGDSWRIYLPKPAQKIWRDPDAPTTGQRSAVAQFERRGILANVSR